MPPLGPPVMNLLRRFRAAPIEVAGLPEDKAAPAVVLACDIAALAPDRAAHLLAVLKAGLDPASDEFARYQAAEALAAAVYPKFKFSEYGRLFLEDRAFLEFYRRFMDPGNWHSLDRKYTLNEMLKLVAHLDGDVVECGCYKGASAHLMCEASRGTARLVHLFDSFAGLPQPESCDGDYWVEGGLRAGEDELHATLAGFDNYRAYKGWIPERFPEIADCRFRFLHIDVDLYRPTLDSLEFFYPRVQPGGIILLDDHGFKSCPGAKQAADEFFAGKPERLAMLPTGQAFTVKLEATMPRRRGVRDMTAEIRKRTSELAGRGWRAMREARGQPATGPERLQWTPALVDRFWDGFSHTRLVEYSFSKQGGRSLLIAVDHLLPRTGKVVDFGAGGGHLVRLMLERGLRVAAYEPSNARLDNLRALVGEFPSFLGVTGADSEETFDALVMAEVIEHILDEDLDPTLRRMAALVKPGGTLIVTTPNNEDLDLGMAYCPASNQLFHRWQHVRSFTRDSLCALLDRFGIDEVATHYVGFDDNLFVPFDELWGGAPPQTELPDYLVRLRRNEPAQIGSGGNLLFVGRRRAQGAG